MDRATSNFKFFKFEICYIKGTVRAFLNFTLVRAESRNAVYVVLRKLALYTTISKKTKYC